MDFISIIAQLVGGGAAGFAGGKVVKDSSLGDIGNLIAGAIGGVGGGTLLTSLLGLATPDAASGLDVGAIISQLVGGGVGGVILQIVVGLIKNKLMK